MGYNNEDLRGHTTGSGVPIGNIHSHKVRLPPSYVDIRMLDDRRVIASLFEYPKGAIHWDVFELSDLPNDLISRSDLERFGIVSLVK